MKCIGPSGHYIDFTHGNAGVRVWREWCQAISRDDENSSWLGREGRFPVPVPDSILGFPHSGGPPTTALAQDVANYDDKERDPELRALLKGWTTFEQALASS